MYNDNLVVEVNVPKHPEDVLCGAQGCHTRGSGTGADTRLARLTQSLLPVFVATGESRDQPQPSHKITANKDCQIRSSFSTELELNSYNARVSGSPCRLPCTFNPSCAQCYIRPDFTRIPGYQQTTTSLYRIQQ